GAYEMAGGDGRYDEGFTLHWSSDSRFEYTHTALVESIWQQMQASSYHGVESKEGQIIVSHSCHALWTNLLHDNLHGSGYAAINDQWLDFVRRNLTLRGPCLPGRGVFTALHLPRTNFSAPIGLNALDAWSLALLAPLWPDHARALARR